MKDKLWETVSHLLIWMAKKSVIWILNLSEDFERYRSDFTKNVLHNHPLEL